MVRRVHREYAVAPRGAAHAAAAGHPSRRVRGLLRPHRRARRALRAARAHRAGDRRDHVRRRATRPTALTRRVRAMHRRVRGELPEAAGRFPAGTPYAADDPELLLWILAAIVDSTLLVYGKYVRRLIRDERDAYWQDYRVSARSSGCASATCPRRSRTSTPTCAACSRRRPPHHAGGARARAPDRPAPAGAAAHAADARARQPDHGRAAARATSAAATGCRGIRRARSRCTAGPSTCAACWCRCCRRLRVRATRPPSGRAPPAPADGGARQRQRAARAARRDARSRGRG